MGQIIQGHQRLERQLGARVSSNFVWGTQMEILCTQSLQKWLEPLNPNSQNSRRVWQSDWGLETFKWSITIPIHLWTSQFLRLIWSAMGGHDLQYCWRTTSGRLLQPFCMLILLWAQEALRIVLRSVPSNGPEIPNTWGARGYKP
jgi:hypothetical protein